MKTKPIYLKKCNTTIQFVEVNNETYLLEENHNINKICVIKQNPPNLINLNLFKLGG